MDTTLNESGDNQLKAVDNQDDEINYSSSGESGSPSCSMEHEQMEN